MAWLQGRSLAFPAGHLGLIDDNMPRSPRKRCGNIGAHRAHAPIFTTNSAGCVLGWLAIAISGRRSPAGRRSPGAGRSISDRTPRTNGARGVVECNSTPKAGTERATP